jgi:pimeloyl-ACP methyl ester carboxylesterase
MSDTDLDYYTGEFTRSGFRGPLNRYRASDIDFADQAPFKDAKIMQPAAFIAGTLEPVLRFLPGVDMIEIMRKHMADLRLVEMIDGGGHWIQQEKPAETTAALLKFLAKLDA